MSAMWQRLDPVPDIGWLKRKKIPSDMFAAIVDDPSKRYDCLTINNGAGILAFTSFNKLGASNTSPDVPVGVYRMQVSKQAPTGSAKYHKWIVSLDDIEVPVTKSAAFQWDFFEKFQDCEPFVAVVMKAKVYLVYCVSDAAMINEILTA